MTLIERLRTQPPIYGPKSTTQLLREEAANALEELLGALKGVVDDIHDYERVNNLSPSPGKRECWQSVTRARAAIAQVSNVRKDG